MYQDKRASSNCIGEFFFVMERLLLLDVHIEFDKKPYFKTGKKISIFENSRQYALQT
jgi:hypothetical protein